MINPDLTLAIVNASSSYTYTNLDHLLSCEWRNVEDLLLEILPYIPEHMWEEWEAAIKQAKRMFV